MDTNKLMLSLQEKSLEYGPKIALAIVTLIVGTIIIKFLEKILNHSLEKMDFDKTLRPYLVGMGGALLKVVLYISVVGMLGVKTTSFIAVLGAAGLAVGMALQGSLSNFAGGVLLLIFKPLRAGDFVQTQGISGTVESIQPFVTVLKSADKVTHFIPNGAISSGPITNYSISGERRVDLNFGIGYSDDIDKAKLVFKQVVDSCEHILKDQGVDIFVSELADSSVNFVVRVFCKTEHYWGIYFYMQENVKKQLDLANISIPYPQQDIHLHNNFTMSKKLESPSLNS